MFRAKDPNDCMKLDIIPDLSYGRANGPGAAASTLLFLDGRGIENHESGLGDSCILSIIQNDKLFDTKLYVGYVNGRTTEDMLAKFMSATENGFNIIGTLKRGFGGRLSGAAGEIKIKWYKYKVECDASATKVTITPKDTHGKLLKKFKVST